MSFAPKKSKALSAAQARADFALTWNLPLCSAPCGEPIYCLYAALCSPCASYTLRQRALHGDMSRYVCCAGYYPCAGRCGESNAPECCLCLETTCCFVNSVASTHFLLQDERRIQNSQCDNIIIETAVGAGTRQAQYISCILHIVAMLTQSSEIDDLAELVDCLADAVQLVVCACVQAQHKRELDVRDGLTAPSEGSAGAGAGAVAVMPPPVQHMQMQPAHHAPPPPGFYPPPQPGYAQQQQGYPQQGYPAHQGYPQQAYPQNYAPPQKY